MAASCLCGTKIVHDDQKICSKKLKFLEREDTEMRRYILNTEYKN